MKTENCSSSEAFTYIPQENGLSSMFFGALSTYSDGGYAAHLNLDFGKATKDITQLNVTNWIDRQTRFVVLESMMYNVNSRLFSRLKMIFEISTAGLLLSEQTVESTRLYPYVEMRDYVMLVAQLIFIAIVIVRLFLLMQSVFMCRNRCNMQYAWSISVQLVQFLLGLAYLVCYIWRIERTINAIEVLMNNKGM